MQMSNYPMAAQNAILHTAIGIAAGTLIERVLPHHDEGEAVGETMQDTLLQAALNGVIVVFLNSTVLSNDDSLGGGMFFTSLFAAQPVLHKRIAILSSALTAQTRGVES